MEKFNRFITLLILLVICSMYANAQQLYVGANYHPHDDKNLEKIRKDISLMKDAGLNVVRMGHLAWDSYEPTEGNYDFEWFDKVMDMMNKAGIKVILDIAIRPAPLWLHQDWKSTRLNSSHQISSYAVFCLKTKNADQRHSPLPRRRQGSPAHTPHPAVR